MSSSASSLSLPGARARQPRSFKEDARIITLVGLAHGASHFAHLLLAVMVVYLVPALNLSFTQVGLLGTVFFVVSGVGQFFSGHLVDRYGARPMLFAALGSMMLACVVAALAPSYATLLLVPVLAGLGNAPFHPIDYSILNQRVSQARLGHAYSVHGIGGSLGWTLAPVLLLGVAHFAELHGASWRVAYGVAALFYLVVIAVLWWQRDALHTESQRTRNKVQASASAVANPHPSASPPSAPQHAVDSTWGFMRLAMVWWCFAFFALVTMPLSMVQYFAQSIYQIWYQLTPLETGNMLSAYLLSGVLGAVVGGFLVSHMPDQCERILAVLIAAGAGLLALVGFGGAALAAPVAVTCLVLTGLVVGIANPSRDMTIRRATPAGATGRVYGVVYSGLDLGMALGPALFGLMMDHQQYHLTLLSAAVLLCGSVLVALNIRARGLRPGPGRGTT